MNIHSNHNMYDMHQDSYLVYQIYLLLHSNTYEHIIKTPPHSLIINLHIQITLTI